MILSTTLLLALAVLTPTECRQFNKRPSALSDPVIVKGLKDTNSRRFARGLSPIKPRSLWSPSKSKARRADPSTVPVGPLAQSGFLYAVQPGGAGRKKKRDITSGCMISDGSWYVGGQCATYHETITGDQATFTTSKGPCAVIDGVFNCASGNSATTFTITSSGLLTYDSSSSFSADSTPGDEVHQPVYADSTHAVQLVLNFVVGANTAAPSSTSSTPTASTSTVYPTGTGLTVCSSQDLTTLAYSCSAGATGADTCCTDSQGGHLLQTQFWDTGATSDGPADSWTIHGLWPDNCDGSYQQFCDPSRETTDVAGVLTRAGKTDLLNYMQTYWKDYEGQDETFWEHEFNKHGTCISSLAPTCFNNYQPQEEIPIFFQKTVDTYMPLTTYDWLVADGIVPSITARYTLAQIQATLTNHHGHAVNVNCDGNVFNEVWYHYVSQGGVASGTLIPADPVGSLSTCPSTGIIWYPKYVDLSTGATTTGVQPTSTSTSPSGSSTPAPTSSTPTSSPSNGAYPYATGQKLYVYPTYGDGSRLAQSCLINAGVWYIVGSSGTCGGYLLSASTTAGAPTGTFHMGTSTNGKYPCTVLASGQLSCATGNTPADFVLLANGTITYGGSTFFSSATVPSGIAQIPVFASNANAVQITLNVGPSS